MSTIPTWGPSFRISMDLYINSFDGANLKNGKLAELLRFTNTDGNCCAIGDRIPAIFTDKRGFIQVATQIGNAGNKWRNVRLSKKAWHRLDILQYFWNNKVNRSGSVSPDSLILPSLLLYFFIINHSCISLEMQYFIFLVLFRNKAERTKKVEIPREPQPPRVQQCAGVGSPGKIWVSSGGCFHQKL